MASLATGIVDPTKVGKYRVVLSDALLGKDPKEVYTGVRYNHKPTLSSPAAPHQARIQPTGSNNSSASYHLSFQDDAGRYAYQGSRGQEDNQYVLIFDPEREVFVLHRVDSMFNMNLVRTPNNNDAEDLRQTYTQLEAHRPQRTKPTSKPTSTKSTKTKKPAPKEPKPSNTKKTETPTRAPAKSNKVHHDSEEESSDDDLLTIEDPGGAAPTSNRDFSPGFIDKPRRFSEFIEQHHREEEEEDDDGEFDEVEVLNDADGEDEEDDEDDNFKLPSPIHRQMMGGNINGNGGYGSVGSAARSVPAEQESDEDEEEEMEDVGQGGAPTAQDDTVEDLEALLMAELQERGSEDSDVSEEE